MSKKRKHRGWASSTSATNRHHLCFQKRHWQKGYARAICTAFVRYVPVEYHRELHERLRSVPVPPAWMLRDAWQAYRRDKYTIDTYDVCRAAAWLYVNIPDAEFRKAMQFQIDFFTTRMQGGAF